MYKLGLPKQDDLTIRRAVGLGDERLLKPFTKQKDLRQALRIYRTHHKTSLTKDSRLFPGVSEVLGYLKAKGYKLAVASNRPTRFSRILINHLGLNKYFDYILCADRLKHIKPHPEILNKIMQKLFLKPAEAVYVGDMAIDAQAGARAGLKTVMVTTGSSLKKEIKRENPYRIISKITKLLSIL